MAPTPKPHDSDLHIALEIHGLPFSTIPANDLSPKHASHTSDLRASSRIQSRNRARMEKYYHFKGLSPFDLPSHPNQQSHYTPHSHIPDCDSSMYLTSFPADLSTAIIHRFTPREAYRQAQQWPRPPSYHHSREKKYSNKWQKRQLSKKGMRREIKEEEWREDLDMMEDTEKMIERMDAYERYCYFGDYADVFDGPGESKVPVPQTTSQLQDISSLSQAIEENVDVDEGYMSYISDEDDGEIEGEEQSEDEDDNNWRNLGWYPFRYHFTATGGGWPFRWHRNFTGCHFIAVWTSCSEQFCACHLYWPRDPEVPQMFSLGEWARGALGEMEVGRPWDDAKNEVFGGPEWVDSSGGMSVYGRSDYEDMIMDVAEQLGRDWDIVSLASEAWTEVEDALSDIGSW
ncbi:uncharacterized protein BDR25DRAFT_301177 [Lindgomyces ingoldianus]|uniref:Uncharacterized protein n=1 Tax=Lindgomyces ingoldianus TaxID=673940 RepID=A0ACB6RAR4_9PLEO|nr:uncharacterized protein BDR25DRAFT_301177 [Lindgomyces ingoldianus]KAF2475551.1 hypothetical protein BDR25DRAFT_301177 [Lindgomyces ingoldianus]